MTNNTSQVVYLVLFVKDYAKGAIWFDHKPEKGNPKSSVKSKWFDLVRLPSRTGEKDQCYLC